MGIKCLRTFQAVVTCGTYARAAEQRGYTQSTVTVHIKQLERDLGVPLFERVGRRMVLTPERVGGPHASGALRAAEGSCCRAPA